MVIRGLPISIELDDVKEDLSAQGIVVDSVHYMYSSRQGKE